MFCVWLGIDLLKHCTRLVGAVFVCHLSHYQGDRKLHLATRRITFVTLKIFGNIGPLPLTYEHILVNYKDAQSIFISKN